MKITISYIYVLIDIQGYTYYIIVCTYWENFSHIRSSWPWLRKTCQKFHSFVHPWFWFLQLLIFVESNSPDSAQTFTKLKFKDTPGILQMTFTGIKRMPSKTEGNPDCPFQICIGMSLEDIEVWQNCIEHMSRVDTVQF